MASPSHPVPTRAQHTHLTDEQCRAIMVLRCPNVTRKNGNWEFQHQPEIIRHYMAMLSFPQLKMAMRGKVDCSYKTFSNRFEDWLFPVGPPDRARVVTELYAGVSHMSNPSSTDTRFVQPRPRYLPIQPSQPLQVSQAVATPVNCQSPTSPFNTSGSFMHNRHSVSTVSTRASSASPAYSLFDSVSDRRLSASTGYSSVGNGSLHKAPSNLQPRPQSQLQQSSKPVHDSATGLWNGVLHVIACGTDHSNLMWYDEFPTCSVCGFSRWHALMLHARPLGSTGFAAAMHRLGLPVGFDLAGNSPMHFLMCAGVDLNFFMHLVQWCATSPQSLFDQNAYGQNPLHALNPQGLGNQLINFLEWLRRLDEPSESIFSQCDIYCRTPLQTLLQCPLDRSVYPKIVKSFPCARISLRSLDTSGRSVIDMMKVAAEKLKPLSPGDWGKLQLGISDLELYLAIPDPANSKEDYGFHAIARGARGTPIFGMPSEFQCRMCNKFSNQPDGHSDSALDQMKCAWVERGHCNAPDKKGWTPAHLLLTHSRCNLNGQPETPTQIFELFCTLLPPNNPDIREALHVLDPLGNSLIYNIATRGFCEILEYALSLERASRRTAMVNACSKGVKGKASETEHSVLAAVQYEIHSVYKIAKRLKSHDPDLRHLVEKGNRLKRCKEILLRHGAEVNPTVTTKWKITPESVEDLDLGFDDLLQSFPIPPRQSGPGL